MVAEDSWRRASFGALATVRSGYAFKSSEWCSAGVPVVKIGNIKSGRLVMDGCSYVEATVAKASGFMLARGDILVGLTGYVGDCAIVRDGGPLVLNQRVGKVTPHPEVEPQFVYCVLSSAEFRLAIERASHGSAQANVSPGAIEAIPVRIPPLPEQRAIAHVLGTLDDKIELNRKMSETLEELARTLFKSWFVDFDPVHAKAAGKKPFGMDEATAALFPDSFEDSELGPIPRGWRVERLGGLFSLRNESVQPFAEPDVAWELYSIPAFDLSRMPERALGGDIKSGKYKVPSDAVLVSKLNPVTPRVWPVRTAHPLAICSTEFLVLVPPLEAFGWSAELLKSAEFTESMLQRASGTTGSRQRVRPSEATAILVVAPPDELRVKFSRLVEPLLNRVDNAKQECRTLAELRDTLLPKLLSGEVRVPLDVADAPAAKAEQLGLFGDH